MLSKVTLKVKIEREIVEEQEETAGSQSFKRKRVAELEF